MKKEVAESTGIAWTSDPLKKTRFQYESDICLKNNFIKHGNLNQKLLQIAISNLQVASRAN